MHIIYCLFFASHFRLIPILICLFWLCNVVATAGEISIKTQFFPPFEPSVLLVVYYHHYLSKMSIQTTLPEGSLILVTGASGYIGAHVTKQLLHRGYKVRGTVRDTGKAEWLSTDSFPKEATNGSLELVILNNINDKEQIQQAIQGVAGVVHIATPNTFNPDPNETVTQTVEFVVNLLKAAASEKTVKEFVYTSTIGAATMLPAQPGFHFDGTNWNEGARALAWAPPPYTPDRGMIAYVQGKVEAEQAFWKFFEENKPTFKGNTVIVCTVFGPRLHEKSNSSTSAWLWSIYNNNAAPMSFFPSCMISPLQFFLLSDI